MVTFCWPYDLVVHVQFLVQSGSPGAPQGDLVQKNLSVCLRGLIEVLFCWIHDLDVECASLVQSFYRCTQVKVT